jgi:hypothetical protein
MMDDGMTGYDPLVKKMLDRQVPLRLDAPPDWADALHRAHRDRGSAEPSAVGSGPREWLAARMQRRRFLIPALAVLVLVVAGAATAAGARFWRGPSSISSIDPTKATRIVQYTLISHISTWKTGDTIALWRFPQPDGSACVFTALSSPKATAPGANGDNPASGGFCNEAGSLLMPGKLISATGDISYNAGGSTRLVFGEVRSGSGIVRVELRSANGSSPLALSNGWYLGQPLVPSTSSRPVPGGHDVVVGYDANGKAIAEFDLTKTFGWSRPKPSANDSARDGQG